MRFPGVRAVKGELWNAGGLCVKESMSVTASRNTAMKHGI